MLIPDLAANGLLLALDLALVAALLALRKRGRSPVLALPLLAIWGAATLFVALFLAQAFGLRFFAVMRFLGFAGLWHLPALLLFGAATSTSRSPALRNLFAAGAAVLAAVYVFAYHVEPRRLEITRFELRTPHVSRPVTIVQLSDLQTDDAGAFEERVVSEIARIAPDLVVDTGDLLQLTTAAEYLEKAAGLARLFREKAPRPKLGWFALEGDSDIPSLRKAPYEGFPVRFLENECAAIPLPGGGRLALAGLLRDTSRTQSFEELAAIRAGCGTEPALTVWAGHAPDYALALEESREPFLALAGHTHGGQVQLPFFGPPVTLTRVPREFAAGRFAPFGKGILSVSRGLGMERHDAPRLRFLCRPELRVIVLLPQS